MERRPFFVDGLTELGYLAPMVEITTLLELRKRAEFFTGKMHGGSMMVCDAHTLLACLDSLASELETVDDPDPGVRYAYKLVAQRLRGQDVEL
jgi:hypothetical protein